MPDALVLDNVVLSAFHTVGWFDALEHWTDDYDVLTTERIWEREFLPQAGIEQAPAWLEIYRIESQIDPTYPGQLSDQDWSCIIAAEERDGVVVTRDQELRSRVDGRNIAGMWLGSFVIQTYEGCGISTASYERNLEEYFEDSYAPEDAKNEIRNAEKE